jgi:hypothetical protein
MPNPKEVARIAAEQRRAARVLEVAQQFRQAAQAEYDALVAAHVAAVSTFPTALQEIEQRSAVALQRRNEAALSHAEAGSLLNAVSAEYDGVEDERRAAAEQHLRDVEQSRQQITDRTPQLALEYWMDRAAAQVATESPT